VSKFQLFDSHFRAYKKVGGISSTTGIPACHLIIPAKVIVPSGLERSGDLTGFIVPSGLEQSGDLTGFIVPSGLEQSGDLTGGWSSQLQ